MCPSRKALRASGLVKVMQSDGTLVKVAGKPIQCGDRKEQQVCSTTHETQQRPQHASRVGRHTFPHPEHHPAKPASQKDALRRL